MASVTMALGFEAAVEPTEEPLRRVLPESEAFRENEALRDSLTGPDVGIGGGGECGGG